MKFKMIILNLVLAVSTFYTITANAAIDPRGCRLRCDLEFTHCSNVTCAPAFYFPWIYEECVDSCSTARRACYTTCSFIPVEPPNL